VPVSRLYDIGRPVLGDLVFASGGGLAAIDFDQVRSNQVVRLVVTGVLLPEL
jgi:hypothetical protein